MKPRAERMVFILIALGAFLIFLSLVLLSGFGPWGGPWSLAPKDLPHVSGWAGALGVAASAAYSLLRRGGYPGRSESMLRLHCLIGLAPLPLALIHVYGGLSAARPVHWVSYFLLILMAVTQVTGVVLRTMPGLGVARYYARSIHTPVALVFYANLAYHFLDKLGAV